MTTKVHIRYLCTFWTLIFLRVFHFLEGLMLRHLTSKDDENIFNAPTQRSQKTENTYNIEGPKGPEVRKSNKT